MEEYNERKKRLDTAKEKKQNMQEKLLQKQVTKKWLFLPEREKHKFRSEEERRHRLYFKDLKMNLWRWRGGKGEKMLTEKEKTKIEIVMENIGKIEAIIEKVKREDE